MSTTPAPDVRPDPPFAPGSAAAAAASPPPSVEVDVRTLLRNAAAWWVQRNPTYLLSAACMAVGARLYLVHPGTAAGDLGVILITLGVLQLYEWAVAGVLVLLHRFRKAPEDQPSLLLVAALFWTGPLAATVELSAQYRTAGLLAALAIFFIGWLELWSVQRALRLRLGLGPCLAATACFALLVIAPAYLHVGASAGGTDDIFLYLCWWWLALFALAGGLALRWQADGPPTQARLVRDALFLLVTTAAAAAHLYAMNYAYYGHARAFYAGPLLLVVAAVIFELHAAGVRMRGLTALAALMPLGALATARYGFDPAVPTAALPESLQKPVLLMGLLTVAVYWFGAWRTRQPLLFHLGTFTLAAAATYAARQGLVPFTWSNGPPLTGPSTHVVVATWCFALAAYFAVIALLRRGRQELALALLALQVAAAATVWDQPRSAPFVMGLVAGWSVLLALHIASQPPARRTLYTVLGLLLFVSLRYDFDPTTAWWARGNAALLCTMLLIIAWRPGWPGYRGAGAMVGGCEAGFLALRGLTTTATPVAIVAMCGAFLLLAMGAWISWSKPQPTPPSTVPSPDAAGEAEEAEAQLE